MTEPAEQPEHPAAPLPGDEFRALRDRLDTVSERPLAEHADVYQQVHVDLQSALAAIDEV